MSESANTITAGRKAGPARSRKVHAINTADITAGRRTATAICGADEVYPLRHLDWTTTEAEARCPRCARKAGR